MAVQEYERRWITRIYSTKGQATNPRDAAAKIWEGRDPKADSDYRGMDPIL